MTFIYEGKNHQWQRSMTSMIDDQVSNCEICAVVVGGVGQLVASSWDDLQHAPLSRAQQPTARP